MSLSSRINHPERRADAMPVIVERRGGAGRRLPRWIQRKNEQGIARDETGRLAA